MDEQFEQIELLADELKEQTENCFNKKDFDVAIRTCRNKMNAIPTAGEEKANEFYELYADKVSNNPNLSERFEALTAKIKGATSSTLANTLYNENILAMETELSKSKGATENEQKKESN